MIEQVSEEMMNLYSQNSKLNINRKDIPIGSVIYYIHKTGWKWKVRFGTVEEHYISEIDIQLYDIKDTRLINGVPAKEFKTPTRWEKLPKGWGHNTKLVDFERADLPPIAKKLNLNNPDDILTAIKEGIFVKVQNKDYCKFEVDIDSHQGWRIIRRYPSDEHHPTHISLRPYECFRTYEAAQKIIDTHMKELERQANLTDLEWSIEQIDNNIGRFSKLYNLTQEEKERLRNRIMENDNLEDVETRISDGSFQWKYWEKARWTTIDF